jgi:glucosamine kinase
VSLEIPIKSSELIVSRDACDKNIRVAYYLGIDGGGSKTTCVVGDEGSILARATSGPSNITRVGEETARASLHDAIRRACAAADIDPRQVKRGCIGVAGAGREPIASAIRKIIEELISGEIEVVGDMQIALQAALGEGPGVIVIAGTGSIAFGRDAQGKTARTGGWGYAISDEGSAYWIGREAIRALLRAEDQAQDNAPRLSTLFRELKSAWKVDSLEHLARAANSRPDFAELLPAIVCAAESGDELAKQILARAGSELAQLAAIVVQRLFPEEPDSPKAIPLGMAGGVFRHASLARERFVDEVHRRDERVKLNPNVVEPVDGALEMARRAK